MEFKTVVKVEKVSKKYKSFELDIENLAIPQGMATAFIGENGAGKTTLLNCITGSNLDYKGNMVFWDKYTDKDRDDEKLNIKQKIGVTTSKAYYMPQWTIEQINLANQILFEDFDEKKFYQTIEELGVATGTEAYKKEFSKLSDGMKVKVMLANVLARKTELLVMDEPASPLDPLMRERLCELIREYLEEDENRSVIFSTHNIADMESVCDYAVIIQQGKICEQGLVDELKEKYVTVHGEAEHADEAKQYMIDCRKTKYNFEGLVLAENIDKLSGLIEHRDTPTLNEIVVGVMKANSKIFNS